MDKRLKTRWGLLALGTVVLLFAGIIYAWSLLKAPFANEFGWSDSALTFNFTLTMCFFCLGGLVSGLLAKKLSIGVIGPKRMNYSKVIGMINQLATGLDRMFSDDHLLTDGEK